MILDEATLDLWIETLRQAKQFGFSTQSSPVQPLLEVMVDISLKLSNLLQERGTVWKERNNPSIKFLDFADSLGNPKSIKLWDDPIAALNPPLAKYFSKLALDLSKILRTKDLPKDLYSEGKDRNNSKERSKKRPQIYHYFRRTQRKRN